ncbi:MAG: thioredoxin domain-containing protein [Verrucomicrobia bacterium]|nr:thioredoxin domain-containing protein [Verrucomicrobiota bacterium]
MSNRLAQESSLYLRQHEANPVHWWPWCAEAFAEAKAKDKPVLVSVGYSSCHWCHVMARESFEQPWVADLMNQHFVCIKVDREERPEVDKLMMDAVQMIQGHGGWPLNCFCLPDGRPFFGGTYFPPEDRGHGQVPWPQLLMRVADFYHRNKSELAANADAIAQNLTHLTRAPDADGTAPTPEDLVAAARRICEQHDDTFGGFGGAPKFPAPHTLNLLLGLRGAAAVEADRALATRVDAVLTVTLGAMARGGLFDQFGGGFHRYCVDRDWTVPHFEKMLYDNAQLLGTYAEAWARYRDPLYVDICEETVDWLLREMRTANGLFAASLDADTDHHEGTTYVWTAPEVAAALGDEAFAFAQAYGLSDQGNFEGKNIPKLRGDHAARRRFAGARAKLRALRDRRPQPARDDKNLLSWNALLVGNLAKAGWILGRRDWIELALETEANLWARFAREGGARLRSVAHGDKTTLDGNLSDFATGDEAELSLAAYAPWARPGAAHPYATRAERLLSATVERFGDPHAIGAFVVPADREDLSVRQKDWFDNAVPAGNSSLLHGFGQLQMLSADPRWAREFAELTKAYGGLCKNVPNGVAHALDGIARFALGHATVKAPGGWDDLRAALNGDAGTAPHARPYRPVFLLPSPGEAGFAVCVAQTCLAPVRTAQEAAASL